MVTKTSSGYFVSLYNTFAASEGCVSHTRKTGHVLVRTSGTKRPVISIVEIGYVRRSEIEHGLDLFT